MIRIRAHTLLHPNPRDVGFGGEALQKGLLSLGMRAALAAPVICGGRLRGDKTSMTHFRKREGSKVSSE